jgi:hypothetical protein
MPSFPTGSHRFDDVVVSIGSQLDGGAQCVHVRVTWNQGGSALFAIGLYRDEQTFRLLVPSSRVRSSSNTVFALHAVPLEERRPGLEPHYRAVGLPGAVPGDEPVTEPEPPR